MLKLDNQVVASTQWKQCSQQCWDTRMMIDLDRVRKDYWSDMSTHFQGGGVIKSLEKG